MKRFLYVLALAVPLTVVAGTKGRAANAKRDGFVNWAAQVIRATGSGAPDLKAANPAQARLGAERAAQADAFQNLLAQAKAIPIAAGRTVGDELAKDEVRTQVESALRGYQITGKRYYSDGGLEIDVEVPFAAIADLLLPRGDPSGLTVKAEAAKSYTALVVDARSLKVTPALAPRLLDEAGKQLYGAELLSAGARKSGGVAAYVRTFDEAKKHPRAGERPLVVKAVRAQGTDLVLPSKTVKKLSDANTAYLAEGRVIILAR